MKKTSNKKREKKNIVILQSVDNKKEIGAISLLLRFLVSVDCYFIV